MNTQHLILFLLSIFLQTTLTHGEAMELNGELFDEIISFHKLVLVNFYADWCRFSTMLKPIFNQASLEISSIHNSVLLARVNCDSSNELAQRFHISKYPTIKLWRNGQPARREYRGERSVEAFKNYVEEQLKDPIHYVDNLRDLEERHAENKKSIIGNIFIIQVILFLLRVSLYVDGL